MFSLLNIDNRVKLTTIWKQSIGSGVGDFYSNLHPFWYGKYILAADRQGIVKAFDINNGNEIWSTNLSIRVGFFSRNIPSQLSGGITVSEGKVFIGSETGKLYALNIHDGSLIWVVKVIGEILSSPAISDDLVLIHTNNGMLQAIKKNNGTIKWTIGFYVPPLILRGKSTPTVIYDIVIIGCDNGSINAILIQCGKIIWSKNISNVDFKDKNIWLHNIKSKPIIMNSIVYAIAYNGKFVALNLYSGNIIWSREIGSILDLFLYKNSIYLVDQLNRIIAVDINNGKIIWIQNKLINRHLTSPIAYNGYVVIGDSCGYLNWIDINDGHFVFRYKVDKSGLYIKPIVATDKLIVQSKNGNVYAFSC